MGGDPSVDYRVYLVNAGRIVYDRRNGGMQSLITRTNNNFSFIYRYPVSFIKPSSRGTLQLIVHRGNFAFSKFDIPLDSNCPDGVFDRDGGYWRPHERVVDVELVPYPSSPAGCDEIAYPVRVYRTGGYASAPGYSAIAGCDPVLVGTLNGPGDIITVSWPSPMPLWTPTYASVEAQAFDASNTRVYASNKKLQGEEAAAGASLVIGSSVLTRNAPLDCGGDWCPCP
jgi:hypothetical protein